MPYARNLEDANVPSPARIEVAVRKVLYKN
jgi:hypothetical protein